MPCWRSNFSPATSDPTVHGSLYYGFGGGMGHLTRALAVRHTLRLEDEFVMLSATPCRQDETVKQWLAPVGLDRDAKAFRAWLGDAILRFQPRRFFVDAFPGGILGELCDFAWPPGLTLIHVARILRWDTYASLLHGALPRYDQTWLVEDIMPTHRQALEAVSARVMTLTLEDPPTTNNADADTIAARWLAEGRPVWLIIHSGPEEETAELLAYARDCAAQDLAQDSAPPRFVIVSPGMPLPHVTDVERIDMHPAGALLPFATRIVTACGFNSMRQAAPWQERHLSMPFARRFDDQFLRRKQMRERSSPLQDR